MPRLCAFFKAVPDSQSDAAGLTQVMKDHHVQEAYSSIGGAARKCQSLGAYEIRERLMPRQARRLAEAVCLALALTVPAAAAEPSLEASAYLEQQIMQKVPQNWQVHVSRRGNDLVAFFMPPYQEAFDLWYEPGQLREKILALCPPNDDAVWRKLAPGQNIRFEPTVGGKSAEAMRLTCPRNEIPPA